MTNVVPLGVAPDAEAVRLALLDLHRRHEAGEDLGSRAEHIPRVAAGLRSLTGGLRRQLAALDPAVPSSVAVREVAETALALAERNPEKADELLRALAPREP